MTDLNDFIDIDEESEMTEVVELKSGLPPDQTVFLAKQVKELSITLVEQSLDCMPEEKNDHTAIVRSTIGTNDGRRYSMLGCASPKTEGTTDPASLVKAASYNGLSASLNCTRVSVATQPKPIRNVTPPNTTSHGGSNPGVKEFRHKTKGPLSPGQERFILGLAQERKRNPDEISRKLVGKSLKDCSSADANEIIQRMRAGAY